MSPLDHSPEVFHLDLGIDRSGVDRLVAEKLLHVPEPGASLEKVRRTRMSERVGMDIRHSRSLPVSGETFETRLTADGRIRKDQRASRNPAENLLRFDGVSLGVVDNLDAVSVRVLDELESRPSPELRLPFEKLHVLVVVANPPLGVEVEAPVGVSHQLGVVTLLGNETDSQPNETSGPSRPPPGPRTMSSGPGRPRPVSP